MCETIPNQTKQTSLTWLNPSVKELETTLFQVFIPVLLNQPLESFNFDNKILKKGKDFTFPTEENNYFCHDAVWEPLQTTVILTSLFLPEFSMTLNKGRQYFFIKPSTAACSQCQAQAAESKVGIGVLKKKKRYHVRLTILMFFSTCLYSLVLCGLLSYSTAECPKSECPNKTLETLAYTILKHTAKISVSLHP